jgi:hypothetical protein
MIMFLLETGEPVEIMLIKCCLFRLHNQKLYPVSAIMILNIILRVSKIFSPEVFEPS